jgi:hypothetical protein
MTFSQGDLVMVDNNPTNIAVVRYADYTDPRKPPVAYSLKWGGQIVYVSARRVSDPYQRP